jgi:1,4-dihydroxy-2-naphthoate octaprenyltransferase
MNDSSLRNDQPKTRKKPNVPLILAFAGVAISMLSESVKNETASYAVFALGVGCTILAILYTIFVRKKAPTP